MFKKFGNTEIFAESIELPKCNHIIPWYSKIEYTENGFKEVEYWLGRIHIVISTTVSNKGKESWTRLVRKGKP